jgi:excinuclease ABC subunit A
MQNDIAIESLDTLDFILVKGARVHNLKNIDLAIPREKLVVITGLSGSGKSSLAFETLYAEGQRRYVESLSSYARQFLGRLDKPDVDWIKGISPAVAIEQKVNTRNPRSTVGTSTEIYDYLKLLFARVGKTISPLSGTEVKKDNPGDVADLLNKLPAGTKILMTTSLDLKHRNLEAALENYRQMGFSRLWHKGELHRIEGFAQKDGDVPPELLIGRMIVQNPEEQWTELADYAQTAFEQGNERCTMYVALPGEEVYSPTKFSAAFEADGIRFEEPNPNLFAFNNPYGACSTCEGFGKVLGIDEDLVIPDTEKSVYGGAVSCWTGEKMRTWLDEFIRDASPLGFPIHKPYRELSDAHKELLWEGTSRVRGIRHFFGFVEDSLHKIQYRVMLSRFRGRTTCPDCKGTRLRKDAGYVKVAEKSIMELVLMPVSELLVFFEQYKPDGGEAVVAKRLLVEIRSRLGYLAEVGLGYLTLNRLSASLSGGESQRINLATSLGSSLVGSMYILDEPSIGLHPRDTERLVAVVRKLRDEGNTVIVVEHDEAFMRAADYLVDMGPEAGLHGGEIVFQGTYTDLHLAEKSYTADYLLGNKVIPVPLQRRALPRSLFIKGARENNLKRVDVRLPLGGLTAITGVSGSGKTTLIKSIVYPTLKRLLGHAADKPGRHDSLEGDLTQVNDVFLIDQNPIGKSSRSNPVTYLKVYDDIRALYAAQPGAKGRGLKPAHFSFNVPGGRCDTCEGEGVVRIEMQFMADLVLPCEECGGKRFKEEVLQVTYEGLSISDLLNLSVDESITFFETDGRAPKIAEKLRPLKRVGLGYIKLGQSSSTLSGGEAQRVKLAWFLSRGTSDGKQLFIFDEPTTGLHTHDVRTLLEAFDALIANGHSIWVIEHHLEVIKCSDWVVDLGPDGGDAGGFIVAEGTPEQVAKVEMSYTGKALRALLS